MKTNDDIYKVLEGIWVMLIMIFVILVPISFKYWWW